jgi:HK97 family phage portal protein
MKLRLPLIGRINTGKDANGFVETVDFAVSPTQDKEKEKFIDALGGLLDFGGSRLSSEKTVSHKLLEANKEWVYRNNDVIAQEVSKLEFSLYSMGLKNGEIVYNEIEDHPLLDLLDKFNGSTTKADGIYITQSHKKLTGDAFWLLERKGKAITNIYILPPDKIELKLVPPDDSANQDGLISAYVYKDNIDGTSIERVYEPKDIIHFKKPNPNNPFRGYGAVEAIAETIDTDSLTGTTQRSFFENGAITNFVLTTDSNLTNEQLKRLRAELRAAYTGAKNAFTAMIFGNGLKPSSIGFSNKDLQFIELQEWFRDKIMICFGNTKASIGIVDDVNRASHQSSINSWLSNTVKPDMESIVGTLNEFLVPQFGDKLVLGFEDPVPVDRSSDIDEAILLKNAGIITVNEARELAEYDTIDGGDIFAPSGTITAPPNPDGSDNGGNNSDQETPPSDEAPSDNEDEGKYYRPKKRKLTVPYALKDINIKQILRSRNLFMEKHFNHDMKEASKPLIRQMLKGKRKDTDTSDTDINPYFSNENLKTYYEKQIHVVGTIEEHFQKVAEKYIGEIENEVFNNFEENATVRQFKRFIKKDFLSQQQQSDLIVRAELDFMPLLAQELAYAGQEAFRLLNINDTYSPFALHDKVREAVRRFAGSMIDTDQEKMSQIIEDGIEAGKTVYEIRKAMQDEFINLKNYQAERVTRTEIIRAANMAAEDAFLQSGVVEGKQWLTAPGADALCAPYAGKVVKLRGNFYDDTSEFLDGNPPLHPNCRCILIPVVVGTAGYKPDYQKMAMDNVERIKELESQIDKRTKDFKDMKREAEDKASGDAAYIKALEKYLGVSDDR